MQEPPAIAWHVMSRLVSGEVIVQPTRVRDAAAALLDVGRGYGLVVVNAADTHIHSLVACDRVRAGRFARAMEAALTVRLGLVGFAPAHFRPVDEQRHLRRVVPYILGQARRHGLAEHSVELSNLGDLVGARERGAYTRTNLRGCLPRLGRAELLAGAGLDALAPGSDPRFLREAALRAACAPDWRARTPDLGRARRAACRVGLELGLARSELVRRLELDRSVIYRAVKAGPDPVFERAIRLQLGLIELGKGARLAA